MKVVEKKILANTTDVKITELKIVSADIALKAEPGQFVVVMVSESGERIPLTVVDKDIDKGTISLILQEAGLTTKLLGKLEVGDSLYVLVGPLGHPTEIKNYGKVVLVGGGVGIAEIFPAARALKEKGNYVIIILGARTKDLLILEEELREVSDQIHITTDDGSYGRRGFTTDVLKEVLTSPLPQEVISRVYAVGPIPMMKAVSSVTKDFNVETIVSLNALMVDATGMCGCCRVTVNGQAKFTCIDGPEFNACLVDWDELEKRNRIYLDKEKHICNLYKV